MRQRVGWICSWAAHAKSGGSDAGVHCTGAGGPAGQFQSAQCAGAKPTGTGSTVGPSVRIHEPAAQPAQDFVLGRLGVVGVRQAPGTGPFLLAQGRGRECHLARRTVECVVKRTGSAGKRRLVSALKSVTLFFTNLLNCLNKIPARASEKTIR